jgi:hypothetical protein
LLSAIHVTCYLSRKNKRKFVLQIKKNKCNKIFIMKKLLSGLFVPVNKKEINASTEEVHEGIANTNTGAKEKTFTTADLCSIQRRKQRIAIRRFADAGM